MKGGLLMWVAIAAGVILIYAAYKGKSPVAVVSTVVDSAKG